MSNIQTVRGTHDLFGNNLLLYKYIRKIISEMANNYDYEEIETPIFENSELFKKPLGEYSDVVLKEMYSFEDRNQSSLTLRPEFTVPMIRASITHNLLNHLPVKLFGIGSMFRRERPQKGRYRQFNQINFEILGTSEPTADAELIVLAYEFLKNLKINDKVDLQINSLGDLNTISKYNNILSDFYDKYKNDLSQESKIKIRSNPLRILDSKNPEDSKINQDAPKISDYYSKTAKEMFENVQSLISSLDINFSVNENLVRGLDYYCHTVFEFKARQLGSQNTLIGGGRYDGLVKTIGGPDIPGVGWASGIERIIMLLDKVNKKNPLVQLITIDNQSKKYAFKLLALLRKLKIKVKYDHKINIKKSLKNANQEKIKYAIIIGTTEEKNNNYTLKNLLDSTQQTLSLEELLKLFQI
tara:strand:- start:17 stop:1255 length:1239 start_codon:yes stop_codon:yes gene_type:complete